MSFKSRTITFPLPYLRGFKEMNPGLAQVWGGALRQASWGNAWWRFSKPLKVLFPVPALKFSALPRSHSFSIQTGSLALPGPTESGDVLQEHHREEQNQGSHRTLPSRRGPPLQMGGPPVSPKLASCPQATPHKYLLLFNAKGLNSWSSAFLPIS